MGVSLPKTVTARRNFRFKGRKIKFEKGIRVQVEGGERKQFEVPKWIKKVDGRNEVHLNVVKSPAEVCRQVRLRGMRENHFDG